MANRLEFYHCDKDYPCSRCERMLPLHMFHRNKNRPNGAQSVCKDCKKLEYAERKLRPSRQQRDAERILLGDEATRLALRKAYLQRTYGITVEEFDAILARQNGACDVCKVPGKPLQISTNHAKQVQGLLCRKCAKQIQWMGMVIADRERVLAYTDQFGPDPKMQWLRDWKSSPGAGSAEVAAPSSAVPENIAEIPLAG